MFVKTRMKYKKSLTRINVVTLGVINGLVVGLALEKVRLTYLNHKMTQAAREYAETHLFVDFSEARWEPLVPLVSVAVFAVVAYVIYECFLNRPRLLLVIWLGLGIVALPLGYYMSTSNPDIFTFLWLSSLIVVTYLMYRLWRSHPNSLPLLWAVHGISAVVVIAVGVQLVGLFFYWPELRKPMTWLIGLVGVVTINMVFGVVVQLILNRFNWRKGKDASVQ